MIKKGYPLFKQFKSLSPEELLDLFLEISEWPEYNESNFRAASNVLLKQRDEDEEIEEDEHEEENDHAYKMKNSKLIENFDNKIK